MPNQKKTTPKPVTRAAKARTPTAQATTAPKTKLGRLEGMLRRAEGATIGQAKRPHVLRPSPCALRCTVVQTQRALTSRILLPLPWCGPTEPFAAGARYIGSTASAVRWHGC